jgi:uncharacterized protein YjaG (DUF416 family)
VVGNTVALSGRMLEHNESTKHYVVHACTCTRVRARVFQTTTGFGESRLIYQVLQALFSELYRLRHGTIKNFVIAVVIPLEIVYPRPAS